MPVTPSAEQAAPSSRVRQGKRQFGLPAAGSGLRSVTKMRIILAGCLIACPLSLLLAMEHMTHIELGNMLAAWIAMGFILLAPLSHWCARLVALRSVQELNVLCEEMKSGNLTPFSTLPPEPSGKDPLQTLRHNMFWIGHIIDSRQKALNGAMRNLNAAQAQMVESIEYASLIQSAFLPEERMLETLFADHFLLWEQRDAVGGDAYWVKETPDGFFVAVVDCTGHGVPGAFMTLIVHSLFERLDVQSMQRDPAGVLAAMNRAIKRALAQDRENPLSDDGMDCAMLFVDTARSMLHFSGARSSLVIRDASGDVREVKGDRRGAGYVRTPDTYAFANHALVVEPGARYYMLTDGLVDQVGGDKGLPFGRARFREFVATHGQEPMAQQKHLLQKAFREYLGREARRDDMTVLGCMMQAG